MILLMTTLLPLGLLIRPDRNDPQPLIQPLPPPQPQPQPPPPPPPPPQPGVGLVHSDPGSPF